MLKAITIAAALAMLSSAAAAQTLRRPTSQTSGTITLTDTFQSIKAADDQRSSCTIQNKGSNIIYLYFGAIASATKDGSIELATKERFTTNVGGVSATDAINATGTTADKWVVACQ